MLQSVLQDIVDVDYIHSAVVFMPECEFKTAMPSTVFKGKTWVDYIKTFNTEVIPAMKLKRIQLRIEKEVLEKSWKTNREHVAHFKTTPSRPLNKTLHTQGFLLKNAWEFFDRLQQVFLPVLIHQRAMFRHDVLRL